MGKHEQAIKRASRRRDEVNRICDEAEALLANLTPKQQSRALAIVEGETVGSIAKREGVSPAAISQSIASNEVREFIRLGRSASVEAVLTKGSGSLSMDIIHELVRLALKAERAVVAGNTVQMVPDNAMRFTACNRLLEMLEVEPTQIAQAKPQSLPTVVEETISAEEIERTTHRRRREVVKRTTRA